MPYIKQQDRPKFMEHIMEVVQLITKNSKPFCVRADYFGFFVKRLVVQHMRDSQVDQKTSVSFHSGTFPEDVKKGLLLCANKLSSLINGCYPITSAGDLNYCITAVMLGVAGMFEGVDLANYGQRAYLRGVLETVINTLSVPSSTGSPNEMAMAERRLICVRGVLGDVISEWYSVFMVPYEEGKRLRNGVVWLDGELYTEKEIDNGN